MVVKHNRACDWNFPLFQKSKRSKKVNFKNNDSIQPLLK